jgi:putative hydrolase of the HAD superfamily
MNDVNNIKVILFDYAGTLGTWDEKVFLKNIAKKFDMPEEEIDWILNKEGWMFEMESGNRSCKDFIEHLNLNTGRDVGQDEYFELLEGVYYDNPHKIELVKKLKEHFRIFITQNALDFDLIWQHDNLPSFELFERIFTSSEIGCKKTDKEYFDFVIDEVQAEPKDILYFDDVQKYVDVAKGIGINAFLSTEIENKIDELIR